MVCVAFLPLLQFLGVSIGTLGILAAVGIAVDDQP